MAFFIQQSWMLPLTSLLINMNVLVWHRFLKSLMLGSSSTLGESSSRLQTFRVITNLNFIGKDTGLIFHFFQCTWSILFTKSSKLFVRFWFCRMTVCGQWSFPHMWLKSFINHVQFSLKIYAKLEFKPENMFFRWSCLS